MDAPFKLTAANISRFEKNIPIDILPLTFQHAIHLSRRLRQRFIWIDTLCIIQDSDSDWVHEAALMGSIYSNSLLTLASASASTDGGLYVDFRSTDTTACDMHLNSTKGSQRVMMYPNLINELLLVESAPVTSRAWCLQERELTTRMVSFTAEQIVWRCKTVRSDEGLYRSALSLFEDASGAHTTLTRPFGTLDGLMLLQQVDTKRHQRTTAQSRYAPIGLIYRSWYRSMEQFSARKITAPTDRLPCLSGMAQVHASKYSDEYLAGLWRKAIISGLLWRVKDPKAARNNVQPQNYLAPSWSWIAPNIEISFEASPFERDYESEVSYLSMLSHRCVPDVLSAETISSSSDPFGRVESGALKLRGLVKTGMCCHSESSTSNTAQSVWLYDVGSEGETGQHVGYVYFDHLIDRENLKIVHCAPLFDWPNMIKGVSPVGIGGGLVSTPTADGDMSKFRRVGYLDWVEMPWFDDCEPSVYTIV